MPIEVIKVEIKAITDKIKIPSTKGGRFLQSRLTKKADGQAGERVAIEITDNEGVVKEVIRVSLLDAYQFGAAMCDLVEDTGEVSEEDMYGDDA